MAASKWPQIKSKLQLVEQWSKAGLTEQQIAHNLGIARSSLSTYKLKYPKLMEALRKGREVVPTVFENPLFRRAVGFYNETIRTSERIINGKSVRLIQKVRRYIPPDVSACAILLKNKAPQDWCDNPQKMALEREIFAHRKRIELAQVFGDEDY